MADGTSKPSNPKDAVGIRKVSLSMLPFRVLWEVALGMLEGALKYGRHNYRGIGVRASVYFDAAQRHLGAWWEGEDIDRESQLSHITKTISALVVLRDSMIQGNWVDDRPIGEPYDLAPLNKRAGELIDLHADKHPHHYTRATPAPLPLPPPVTAKYDVLVIDYPMDKKVEVIKAIRAIGNNSLKEAKDISELPRPFWVRPAYGWSYEQAALMLQNAGAITRGENL